MMIPVIVMPSTISTSVMPRVTATRPSAPTVRATLAITKRSGMTLFFTTSSCRRSRRSGTVTRTETFWMVRGDVVLTDGLHPTRSRCSTRIHGAGRLGSQYSTPRIATVEAGQPTVPAAAWTTSR